jgi:hypothetical protein
VEALLGAAQLQDALHQLLSQMRRQADAAAPQVIALRKQQLHNCYLLSFNLIEPFSRKHSLAAV